MAIREIEFRGKAVIGNKWVYGWLSATNEEDGKQHYWIDVNEDSYQVDPETVGQYTGRKDKNGKKIFDGDIVKQSIHYINSNEDEEYISIVKWKQDWCAFALNHINGMIGASYLTTNDKVEVIGNIYDNPELLEVEK